MDRDLEKGEVTGQKSINQEDLGPPDEPDIAKDLKETQDVTKPNRSITTQDRDAGDAAAAGIQLSASTGSLEGVSVHQFSAPTTSPPTPAPDGPSTPDSGAKSLPKSRRSLSVRHNPDEDEFPDGDSASFIQSIASSCPATEARTSKEAETASFHGSDGSTINYARDMSDFAIRHHKSRLLRPIRMSRQSRVSSHIASVRQYWARGRVRSLGQTEKKWTRKNPEHSYRISLAELQRMHLRKLQCKLVKHSVNMQLGRPEPRGWETDLKEYVTAIQNYEFMNKWSGLSRDPFLVTGERYIDDFVLRKTIGDIELDETEMGRPIPVPGPWSEETEPIGGTRDENYTRAKMKGFRERIIMAALGGFLLIGPMWLMVLHNTLYTTLISTTVFVAVFGVLTAWKLEKAMDVMSATAAYAAVLVVFVGLSSTGPGNTS